MRSNSRPSTPTLQSRAAGGRLTIDLATLRANWAALAKRSGSAATGAVVKADAYGLGIDPVVRTLRQAGCETFFVALLDEGLRARTATPDAAIYVLNGLFAGAAPLFVAGNLRPVLGSMAEVEEWAAIDLPGKPPAAIHVDTGMNRLGLTLAEARILAGRSDLLKAVRPALVMSHLACSDDPDNRMNPAQLERFREVGSLFPGVPASLANSGGILLGRDYHFDLTRPGIALYGGRASAVMPPLSPVVTLQARVILVREADAGDTVGYGAAETLKRRSRIAVLSAGYADGYHRAAGSSDARPGARVHIRGKFAPLIGRVSMDLMTADVTGVPGVQRGDWAELFGPHIPIDEAASHAGTVGYEFLTGLGRRYERIYLP
jgi:alanine racemase